MSLFTFLKSAGEKLFGSKEAPSAPASATASSTSAGPNADERAAQAIADFIHSQKLEVKDLKVAFEGASATVTVRGEAPDQGTREKVVLCCGNVTGVEKVRDEMTVVAQAVEPSRFYTVKSGDTLSKISKDMYGDANQYMKIFDANKPMLKHPDKIYPGQVLRVPA